MHFSTYNPDQQQAISTLFESVFTKSEGESEGKVIGQFVTELMASTATNDLFGFIANVDNTLAGSVFFSRLYFDTPLEAFILSPMAVDPSHQGKGIGQALINFALNALKDKGVELVLTYGDPNFYQKVGFQHIEESCIQAPLPLTYPEGWLAQNLSGKTINAISSKPRCVQALNNPTLW